MTPDERAVAAVDTINEPLPFQLVGKPRARVQGIIADQIRAAVESEHYKHESDWLRLADEHEAALRERDEARAQLKVADEALADIVSDYGNRNSPIDIAGEALDTLGIMREGKAVKESQP